MQRGSSWLNIITGPNMGGKSTFIRQVGIHRAAAAVNPESEGAGITGHASVQGEARFVCSTKTGCCLSGPV